MEKGPKVRLGQLSLVRCCLPLNKCYLRFRCLCGTLLRVLIRFYLDLLCFCRARRFWTAFAAASMFMSCVLGREVPVLYNRLNLVWHLLVDCQRRKIIFWWVQDPHCSPPKLTFANAALKIGVLTRVERVADFIPLGTSKTIYQQEERAIDVWFGSVWQFGVHKMSGFLNLLSNLECVLCLFNSFANA